MSSFDIEDYFVSCLLQKPSLINEVYVEPQVFKKPIVSKLLLICKQIYDKNKTFDYGTILDSFKENKSRELFTIYYSDTINLELDTSLFYEYQDRLIENYKNKKILEEFDRFKNNQITNQELYESINNIQALMLINKQKNKITPEDMIKVVRNKEKIIYFDKFSNLNEKLKIKKKTINVIAARPSEGKSALSLNLFCDLCKKYKCMYFNMEMTEEEVYERMLGIETNMRIQDIITPQTEYQDKLVREAANKIYNYKYEIINGSKSTSSIKTKIIKEQREEHVIVFIDYIGYIVGKAGESDKDRIGNAVRELNNITKDYNCTIFLVAQINRNGSDTPTMQDLKDSGELEQTADTIILIHDENKEDNSDIKDIKFLIPKCRGGKRNIGIPIEFDKTKQIMKVKESGYGKY